MPKKTIYLYRALSTLGPVGFANKMPGTTASALSLILWAPLVMSGMVWWQIALLVLMVFLLGWFAFSKSKQTFDSLDPKEVVIDEVAGQGLALLFCPASWLWILFGLFLFRFFDIVKPWPISLVDRRLKSPLGVMLDDLVAGFLALAVMWVLK